MFRKMRRSGQEVSAEVCRQMLHTGKRAVLSVLGEDGYPYGIPVNFVYDEADETIYLHGAKTGHKIDAIRQCGKVCLTTWNEGYREPGDWAWYVTSVIVRGEAELVTDAAVAEEKVRELGLKYSPYPEEVEQDIREAIHRVQVIAIHIRHMTGKLVHEK